jgi:hypothetical protein
MKNLILIPFLLLSANLFAQPGDMVGMRRLRFEAITKELEKHPNNYELIWERLNIASNPNFDLYSRGNVVKHEQPFDFHETSFWPLRFPFSYEEQLADIDKLIDNKAEIKEHDRISNIVDFTFLRGKIYYLLGDYEKALKNYLFALNNIDESDAKGNNSSKKQAICISLAAYYYNPRDNSGNYHRFDEREENLRQALKYIDMVSPLEFTDDNYCKSIADPFERDKIDLLTYLNENARLENYYKKRMRSRYEYFKIKKAHDDEWDKGEVEKNGYAYSTNASYLTVLRCANELANFYYKKKRYVNAKWMAEQIINYCPTNSSGFIVDRYEVGEHYLLLNKIYQTGDFKDFDKEMNTLIELLGGSNHGINYNVSEIGNYIKARLQEHPEESRLYLALAIWHYKNSVASSNSATASEAEIFELLKKAELLNLEDYRLPFAKAIVYLDLGKDYELGLIEINKALDLYKANPFLYSVKYHLLSRLPNPNWQELEEFNGEHRRKWSVRNYKDMSNFFKSM